MPRAINTTLSKRVPTLKMANREYALIPVKFLKGLLPGKYCKFKPRGSSEGDWFDAMERYLECLFAKGK